MASSPSSSVGHRRPQLADELQAPAQVPRREGKGEEEERDWAALPVDALLAVLGRLDGVDILIGRRPHVPAMVPRDTGAARSVAPCPYAPLCWAPSGSSPATDRVFQQMINQAIRKSPLLEELELSLYHRGSIDYCLIGVSDTCPLLTRLQLNHDRFYYRRSAVFMGGDCECKCMALPWMRRLRSLQLFANSIHNKELAAILDGCRQLEYLDIRHSFNVSMNEEMRERCARVKTVRLPGDSMEDYDLPYGSPVTDCTYYSSVMYPD
ncbi:unnamed protein product [Urochloa decumbens]|uniref:F-box protein n=1 Tax=Urochloa decumbens TaxID=240449 RepID=A0ABC9BXV8_9POAL